MATANTSLRSGSAPISSMTISKLAAIACVGLFGLGLVWAAGFANAATLHNAAHDSRHSLVFSCH